MYSLAAFHINDIMPDNELVVVAAGTILVFGFGSIAGSLSIPVLLAALEPVSHSWGLGAYFVPLGINAFARIVSHIKPSLRRLASLPPRSSTAAVLLAEPSDEDTV